MRIIIEIDDKENLAKVVQSNGINSTSSSTIDLENNNSAIDAGSAPTGLSMENREIASIQDTTVAKDANDAGSFPQKLFPRYTNMKQYDTSIKNTSVETIDAGKPQILNEKENSNE